MWNFDLVQSSSDTLTWVHPELNLKASVELKVPAPLNQIVLAPSGEFIKKEITYKCYQQNWTLKKYST